MELYLSFHPRVILNKKLQLALGTTFNCYFSLKIVDSYHYYDAVWLPLKLSKERPIDIGTEGLQGTLVNFVVSTNAHSVFFEWSKNAHYVPSL